MNADRFGVPDNVFGVHDEEFFSGLGRIAALSALLEHQALGIYQTMTNTTQSEHTQLPASQLIEQAYETLNTLGDDEDKDTLLGYFTDFETALHQRNDYIHNLWPAQSGARLYGWRPNPDKKSRTDQPHVAVRTSLDELKSFIQTLVELIQRRDRVYVAACALQQLRIRPRVTP